MEIVDRMIDRETLKGKYLFPSIPYDEFVCKQVLLSQLDPKLSEEAEDILGNIVALIVEVHHALFITDKRMAQKNEPKELDSKILRRLLRTQELRRIKDPQLVLDKDIIEGKYLVASVLSVPDACCSPAWELAIKSVELYNQRKDDFEFILVIRTRHGGWEDCAKLHDFLTPFHPSCIIMHPPAELSDRLKINDALVIDPKGKVLFHDCLSYLSCFGSAAFPFTDVSTIWNEYCFLKFSSLETLLGVEPSHEVFRKLPGGTTDHPSLLEKEWRCISEFQPKIVFLYTYTIGNCLAVLYDTVISLREKGIEFEIITAFVPRSEYHNNPLQFLEVFSSLVAQRGLSWWVLPYNSSTYPRLRPLFAHLTASDQLIVFDPKLKDGGDPHGLEIMKSYGESMFPFTKMSIVDYVMKELSQVTLQSLFECITVLCKDGRHECSENKSAVLTGKNVFVYFDAFMAGPCRAFDLFVSWYESLEEEQRHNFEVVMVYLDTRQQDPNNIDWRPQFPIWLISPDDEKLHSKHVVDNFFLRLFKHLFSTVVAFGKDGKICSLRAHSLLSSSSSSSSAFPFYGDLRDEVFNILNDNFIKRLNPVTKITIRDDEKWKAAL